MKNQFLTYYLAMLGQILMIPTKITLLLHYAESRCRQILAKKCFSFRPCSWHTILLPDIGVQNPSIKCLEFWQHPLNEEVPIRAVESESLKVGKSLKIGKNRINSEKSDLISYQTFWQKCQNAIKCHKMPKCLHQNIFFKRL